MANLSVWRAVLAADGSWRDVQLLLAGVSSATEARAEPESGSVDAPAQQPAAPQQLGGQL